MHLWTYLLTDFFFSIFIVSLEADKEHMSETYCIEGYDRTFIHLCLTYWINPKHIFFPFLSLMAEEKTWEPKPWGKHAALSHSLVISAGRQAKTSVFQKNECPYWQTTNGTVLQWRSPHADTEQHLTVTPSPLRICCSTARINVCIYLYSWRVFIKWHISDNIN